MKSINNEKPNNPNECTPIQSDDIIIGNLPKHIAAGVSLQPFVRGVSDALLSFRWLRGPPTDYHKSLSSDSLKEIKSQTLHQETNSTWKLLAETLTYCPTKDDENCLLRFEVVSKEDPTRILSTRHVHCLNVTSLTPRSRQMIPLLNTTSNDFKFKVMSYNILADCYIDKETFWYTPAYVFNEPYRKEKIIEEIKAIYTPDIVCLQEVECHHYEGYFKEKLSDKFESIYKKRTSDKTDGCAIFWNKHKFELVESFPIEFNDLITHSSLISFSDTEIRFKQNNVGLIALLQPKSTSKSHHHNQVFLWVANAHLFWNPAYPDVKLFQSWYYLKQIKYYQSYFLKKLAMFKHQSSSKQIPSSWHQNAIPSFHTMICGDFNSTPDSWVYQLFSKSSLSTESIQNPEILAKYKNVIHVTTDFPFLRSAYDNLNDPLTNVQEHFQGCLDYIWYDPESLQLESILENPVTSQELKESVFKYTALPNPFYPSDHLPIMAEFSLKTTTK